MHDVLRCGVGSCPQRTCTDRLAAVPGDPHQRHGSAAFGELTVDAHGRNYRLGPAGVLTGPRHRYHGRRTIDLLDLSH